VLEKQEIKSPSLPGEGIAFGELVPLAELGLGGEVKIYKKKIIIFALHKK